MHEWALAESVIKAAVENAAERRFKFLSGVGVMLGELQAVDTEIFSFALNELRAQYPSAKDCVFEIRTEESVFKCKACGAVFGMSKLRKRTPSEAENIHFIPEMSRGFMNCPSCGSPDFEIVSGRGVSIGYIRGEQ
jgi:Zn finger protein HypA/HybF (possibly regulating hydrogenase expression)